MGILSGAPLSILFFSLFPFFFSYYFFSSIFLSTFFFFPRFYFFSLRGPPGPPPLSPGSPISQGGVAPLATALISGHRVETVWNWRIHIIDTPLHHELRSEWVSEQLSAAMRASKKMSAQGKLLVRSKQIYELCKRMSKWRSKKPSTLFVDFICYLPNVHRLNYETSQNVIHSFIDWTKNFTVPVIAFEFYYHLHMVIQRYNPQQDRLVEFNVTCFFFSSSF